MHQKTRGFSLIEIMTVIAIIAILAAVALPIYSKQRCKAQMAEVPNCLSDVAMRMENYRSNHGSYPNSSSGIPGVLNFTNANCGDYYQIDVFANNTYYYIQATDNQKKLPCSSTTGDDEWVLTSTSPKIYHTKNPINSSQVDTAPPKP
ncbi:MAG: hypothetical protein CSA81_06785 [Acidobacteria bacterium]|nr:MAG: hypothetical protein CSA81_06785 [Acidobacteriota bacterium]PIE90661.1 MAG: hypothetical protein CR997_05145 [Acidobacteriota bacterium]